MKTRLGIWGFSLLFLATQLSACGANLFEKRLAPALIDESYSESLTAEDEDWELFNDSDLVFFQSGGDLPYGMAVAANGGVTGYAMDEVGVYDFAVTVYAIENDDYWDDWWDDGYYDEVTEDTEWFAIFVTERSTNEYCPAPNDENTTGIYLCAGSLEQTELAAGQQITLDMNFFADFDFITDYAIDSVDFTVSYNPDYFYVDSDDLTSAILREAAQYAGASVYFDDSVAGELRVIVTGAGAAFDYSGRFLDLVFTALDDVPAGDYDFVVNLNDITTLNPEAAFPDIYIADGYLYVDADVSAEEATEE